MELKELLELLAFKELQNQILLIQVHLSSQDQIIYQKVPQSSQLIPIKPNKQEHKLFFSWLDLTKVLNFCITKRYCYKTWNNWVFELLFTSIQWSYLWFLILIDITLNFVLVSITVLLHMLMSRFFILNYLKPKHLLTGKIEQSVCK